MNEWIRLGTLDDDGCLAKARMNHGCVDIQIYCEEEEILGRFTTLSYKEALNLALFLPEIKALIEWALNVRDTMDGADLFVHGEDVLKPFIGKEKE